MTVKLFNNQLILEVPKYTEYICFRRMPKIIDFCLQFSFGRKYILTEGESIYITLSVHDIDKWYTTTSIEDGDNHYDATDALLQHIQQQEPQAYEYW